MSLSLSGHSQTINSVCRQSFSRLACLFPWVITVIVDKGKVSLLSCKDPESSESYVVREKLRVQDSLKSEGSGIAQQENVDVYKSLNDIKLSMEKLNGSNAQLVANNRALGETVRLLTLKIDALIEKPVTLPPPPLQHATPPPSPQSPLRPHHTHQITTKDDIFSRVLIQTAELHKRIRQRKQ